MKYIIIALILLGLVLFTKTAHGEVLQVQYQIQPAYKVPMPCAKYIDEIEKYNWDVVTVIKIMWAESRCNPKAKNMRDSHRICKGSYSLLQVGCLHYKGENREDPKENIRIAFEVYKKAGYKFTPWTTYAKIAKQ